MSGGHRKNRQMRGEFLYGTLHVKKNNEAPDASGSTVEPEGRTRNKLPGTFFFKSAE